MIYHKHLLINAKINKPIKTEEEGISFLTNLVNSIDMKIIKGPFASYVDKEGNRGLTAIVMIETSHIAFHIWDETDPALIQFDLYTCGQLEVNKILDMFKETFDVQFMEYVVYDREHGFIVEDSGKYSAISEAKSAAEEENIQSVPDINTLIENQRDFE